MWIPSLAQHAQRRFPVQAEELRGELSELRAELREVNASLEEAENELDEAQIAQRKAEAAQEEQQQRCLALPLTHAMLCHQLYLHACCSDDILRQGGATPYIPILIYTVHRCACSRRNLDTP